MWVEGPSGRVYLKKWLELFAPALAEGIHYAVTFYGGNTLAHFTGCDEPQDDLVEVLRINQHAIFVMDRDDVRPDGSLTRTKARSQVEMDRNGDGLCWVTQGREIENYLRPELINAYLSKRVGQSGHVAFSKDVRLERAIAAATKGLDGPRADYAKEKVVWARGLVELMDSPDLDVFDLRARLAEVVALIRKWNGKPLRL